ncbi:hypothetical protein [Candidatus Trichorickettsia mobilis]|uniref:hypothetical protein n=1 Tax=Candidatus Trichorickettsia mobilis TaxID=1346319 RepID=UPI00292CA780|nr:hypothetical protein [Candidatus Trichorickettsia mobilis]
MKKTKLYDELACRISNVYRISNMTELSQLTVMLRGVYSTKGERNAIVEKLHVHKLHLDLQYDDNSLGISEKLCDLLRTLKIEELSLSPQQLSLQHIKLLIANLPKTIKSLNFVDHQHSNRPLSKLIYQAPNYINQQLN